MKKIFYFITVSLLLGMWSCADSEDIDILSVESTEIPQDTINMYANDPDVIWDEELGWVHINCIEAF